MSAAPSLAGSPLHDARIEQVIERMIAAYRRPADGGQWRALYLAAALRDNGGRRVIGAEIGPGKIAAAWRNLKDAGLSDLVEIRAGYARERLADLGGQIDFALIDGWPGEGGPSLSLEVMQILAPQMRRGAPSR